MSDDELLKDLKGILADMASIAEETERFLSDAKANLIALEQKQERERRKYADLFTTH